MSSSINTVVDTKTYEQPLNSPGSKNNELELQKKNSSIGFTNEMRTSADNKLADEEKEPTTSSLESSFNKLLGSEDAKTILQSRALEFSVSEHEGQAVVKVIDKNSQDVIRQIPSEEFIKMAQRIDMLSDEMQKVRGVLLDKQV